MPGRTISKKAQKAENKSAEGVAHFLSALKKKGERQSASEVTEPVFLAKVEAVKGDGRFTVKEEYLREDNKRVATHDVRLSKTLFAKAAGKRNATLKTAVRIESHVLVDGSTIRAVVGAGDAQKIRSYFKADSAAKSNASNNLFERNSNDASSVNLEKLGGRRGVTRKVRRS